VGFLFKAGFWFTIVLLFLPENPHALQGQREFAQNSARSMIDMANGAAKFCEDRPEICKSASDTSKIATEYLNLAADSIAKQPEKTR